MPLSQALAILRNSEDITKAGANLVPLELQPAALWPVVILLRFLLVLTFPYGLIPGLTLYCFYLCSGKAVYSTAAGGPVYRSRVWARSRRSLAVGHHEL